LFLFGGLLHTGDKSTWKFVRRFVLDYLSFVTNGKKFCAGFGGTLAKYHACDGEILPAEQ